MKKLLLGAFITVSLATSAFATDESKISFNIKKTFAEEFKNVGKVEWAVKSDFVKATFHKDGQMIDAFYDFKGNKIGTSRNINVEELPVSSRKKITEKYPEAKITAAIEFNGVDEESYYVTVEDDDQSVILKIRDASSVSVFKKTRKNKFW
jgi:hypothetical protein